MVLEIGQLRKHFRNKWKVSKRGAGEGWEKISRIDRVRYKNILHAVREDKNILHIIKQKTRGFYHI